MEFPETPLAPAAILAELRSAGAGDVRWDEGRLFSLVYGVSDEHERLLADAYGAYISTNGLGAGVVFRSLGRLEREVIGGTLAMLHHPDGAGSLTSGGTESIIMGMRAAKTARRAAGTLPDRPEVIAPASAHPAFEKAGELMDLTLVRTPLRADTTADVEAVRAAITPRTIALVGSAPNYPFGTVDDIPALAALAAERGLHFHTDACVGGFALPWLERAGHTMPCFDFRVPGVTTISADIHKYGFAARGTSLILYRSRELRRLATFRLGTWVGGPYVTPTLAGSRPGGAIAAAWAVTRYFGRRGYTDLHVALHAAARRYMDAVRAAGFRVLGDPAMSLFAFAATDETLDVNAVADVMLGRGWAIMRQPTTPASLHLLLTPRHAPIADDFARDLAEAVREVRDSGATSAVTSNYTPPR
jgi:glutamate/tyrosine decarboxylase-like PLP-dependent enzyme